MWGSTRGSSKKKKKEIVNFIMKNFLSEFCCAKFPKSHLLAEGTLDGSAVTYKINMEENLRKEKSWYEKA